MPDPDDSPQLPPHRKPLPIAVTAAVQQIEEGLSKLYAAADVKPPDRAARAPIQDQVRAVIEKRRLRFDVFPPMLFSDPAWDILLELYARQLEHNPVNISRLTAALPVAATTTLRWIDKLEAEALIVRRSDPHHAKRVWLDLSQYGRSLMDRYFQQTKGGLSDRFRRLFEPE